MTRRLPAAAAVFLAAALAPSAEPLPPGFVHKTFKNADGTESPYVLYVPKGHDPAKPTPVILFLHGSGESKGGKMMPVEQGLGYHLRGRRRDTFPALVVIPQSEKRTWKADSDDGRRAVAILDAVAKEYNGDPARTYLTGLSMGGYGTWSLAAAHPDRWAAIVPVCGGGDPADAPKIKHLPCWNWHGDRDRAVVVDKSRQMIAALKAAGGDPISTELAGVGHNSWDAAYATDDLFVWLFKQARK